jgi:tetratricopeptide (TPR) repeat protein
MPLWGEQDLEAARDVLERLAPTREARLAKAPTDRERRYLASVEALYGDGDKTHRDANYNLALGELAHRYPADLDARSFYALSWLGLTSDRNTANYMRGAAEAEAVYEINPRHPGALHYLIHAYDDPVHAPLGLRAARRYGKVAPSASHAQHMPSHIFFALGMWDDAIEANIAALATARGHGQGGYHALQWLTYAYLQQGKRDEAAKLVNSVEDDVAKGQTRSARSTLAALRAMWLAEGGTADSVDAWTSVNETEIAAIYPFSAHDYVRGIAAAASGDIATAQAELQRMRSRNDVARSHIVPIAASRYDVITPEAVALGDLLATALEGAILFAQGERDRGLARVREAIATADAISFEYGPPFAAKPLDELLGDLLASAGQLKQAAAAYQKTLTAYPNRRLSVEGLARVREAIGMATSTPPG